MTKLRAHEIKRAQKESVLFREFSQLYHQVTLEHPELAPLVPSRISLSNDKGICTIYFYSADGQATFERLFSTLVLFKPSLRKAIATQVPSRYAPDFVFKYDTLFEKQKKIEDIFIALAQDRQEQE